MNGYGWRQERLERRLRKRGFGDRTAVAAFAA
jgi:hypothetical protein